MARLRLLSLGEVDNLNEKDFTEYVIYLLQLSLENKDAEYKAKTLWSGMTPEERIIILEFMGHRAKPQGSA